MKTDLSGSTVRFRSLPEADLTALLGEHRALIGRVAAGHGGRVVKPEGDGFFICFPSVTAAALAAMAMQEELRLSEAGKGDRRLVMRIVLTLGDVLHEEGAFDRLRDLVDGVCRDFDGVSRMSVGDSYYLTFADPKLALAAVERLAEEWHAPGRPEAARCSLSIGVHKGVLYAFRDFLHGLDLNIATLVERALPLAAARDAIATVTGPVRRDLSGTEWDARFRRVDVGPSEPRLKGIEIHVLARRAAA